MDNTDAATPKLTRRIRVPFGSVTVRALPFEERHLVAIKMSQQMSDGQRKFDVILRTLGVLLGPAQYTTVVNALVDGEADTSDVTALLSAIVDGTKALRDREAKESDADLKAATGDEAYPDPEPVKPLDGTYSAQIIPVDV